MRATQSILLYGVEVWDDSIDKEAHRKGHTVYSILQLRKVIKEDLEATPASLAPRVNF